MGKSLKEFLPSFGKWGWVVVIDYVFGFASVYQSITGETTLSKILWGIVFVLAFTIPPLIAFHKIRLKRDELQNQLDGIKNARPNIEFNVQVAPEPLHDRITGVFIGTPVFAKLMVANNPTSVLSRADAPNVATQIEILGENGALFPAMTGRWANTYHQYQGALPNQVAQMTLPPNGLLEPLLIALKYTGEELAYGLNVENEKMPGWRDPKKPIPIGIWRVKVHLQGINVEETVWLTLTNKGRGTDLELERELTSSTPDKGDSQT